MSIRIRTNCFVILLLALFMLISTAGISHSAEYWLSAQALTKTMPDAQVINMWGFSQCTAGFATCGPATVPGPELVVPPGDNILTVNLRNNLTGPYVEPVSLVITGLTAIMTPVWINHATGTVVSTGARLPGDTTSRMRSLTHETAPGATGVYTWSNVTPGTHLYRSGTHQSVQVQMGLYGVQKKDASLGIAYTGTVYSQEVTLLYSEIDPALHAAIAAGTYGPNPAPPPGWLTSTIDFAPKYFLVNGAPYTAGLPPIPVGKAGQRILLRVLNAGLRDYVPLFQGLYMSILAEEGRLLPNPKKQYSLLLPAGKTVDAIAVSTATAGGTVPVYDRRLNLTNNLLAPGGMLTFLQIGAADGTTIGVYRPSTSTFLLKDGNASGLPDYNFALGIPGDRPLAGDWDGDGTVTIGVYRPSNLTFYLMNSNATGPASIPPFQFGIPGDIPIVGDWDGNGTTTVGVYRPSNQRFYLRNSNSTGAADIPPFQFGNLGDIPIVGDWDGNLTTTIGVYRPSNTTFYLRNSNATGPASIPPFQFGISGDIPIAGDWDGIGGDTIGVYRSSNSRFYLRNSNTTGTADVAVTFGVLGDIPIVGNWDGLP